MMWCPGCGPYGGMMWGWGNWWWGLLMMLFWLLILVGIVLLVVWIVRQLAHREGPTGGTSRALEILQERYARGEITREQYEQMRRDILGEGSRG
ncbi:MAG: SHOCT domain-containing protein [Thermomicrobium sp.]|nr:SHOCT domain-containing protein [Thermomicrobium sp.]MDW8058767.1 SHOCT domain-containing protein [Thermomicrobium sp.]